MNHESIRAWSPGDAARFVGRGLLLAALAYPIVRVPVASLAELFDAAAPYWFVSLAITVLVVGYVAGRSRGTGWKLVGALTLLYGGIQAVSFVELSLYGVATAEVTLRNVVGTLPKTALVVLLIVVGYGRVRGRETPAHDDRLELRPVEWAWKLPLLGAAFLATMIGGGLVVFTPVARFVDPTAFATYELLEPSAWVLPFQFVRGVIFSLLLLPVVSLLAGGYRETQITVALLFAWLLSSGLLVPTPAIPGLLWVAHFVEVFVSMFLYGLVFVPLVFRSHRPLRWLRGRVASGASGAT